MGRVRLSQRDGCGAGGADVGVGREWRYEMLTRSQVGVAAAVAARGAPPVGKVLSPPTGGASCAHDTCAVRRFAVSPAQPGGTRRNVPESLAHLDAKARGDST